MLGRRGYAVWRGKVRALKAAHLGFGVERRNVGVLSRPFGDASPTCIARDVEHGRKGHGDAVSGGFRRGLAGRLFPQNRIERGSLGQWDGENRPVSVQNVESEEQRNAEPRFFDGDALNAVCSLRPERY